MFGKGVYFADASSKSANYSMPEPNRPGFLLLSEVALGEMNELYVLHEKASLILIDFRLFRIDSNYNAHELPNGKQSVRGIGRSMPDPKLTVIM